MIEFEYPHPAWRGHMFYAPQLRVRETSGLGIVDVIDFSFTIPYVATSYKMCAPKVRVPPGEQFDLFTESYGDYELTLDRYDGRPAIAGDAMVVVTFRDKAGRIGMLKARGPVVPGVLPATFSGGVSHQYYRPSYPPYACN